VIIFSTADPSRQLVASSTPVVAPIAVVALAAFALRQRQARQPLLEPRALGERSAWGALAVNLALGAALMAALVDVPFFARATRYPDSQLGAALVLVRFLVAVPVGAVLGGWLCRRRERGPLVAAAGGALAAAAFATMVSWSTTALSEPLRVGGASLGLRASDLELVACGLGFGLAIAPVNAAILEAVPSRLHGLASSLVVVARTIGMLAGLSALTAVGIRRFYEAQAHIGSPLTLCPANPGSCPAYEHATTAALLSELHAIFAGAAVCAGVGAVLSVVLLRRARSPETHSAVDSLSVR
jgi:MFS family permease